LATIAGAAAHSWSVMMNFGNFAPNTLEGEATIEGDQARLTLRGTLATRTVDRADVYVTELQRRGIRELEIDLSELTRLDSSGLAFLLRVHHRAPEDGWAVAMVAPPEHLRSQISRLGVATRLPFLSV
jgi:ABC-type transporter Mla MlaB component